MRIATPYHSLKRLVILAPNWLGDAVMALPAIADVRRAAPSISISVAARPAIIPLFWMASTVDEAVEIDHGRGMEGKGFEAALLLPNSFYAAWITARARITERWGYRTGWRGPLLTRSVEPPAGVHQVKYYQQLVRALDVPNGPAEPELQVPADARQAGAQLLRQAGWDGRAPLVALAPGAAYGGAKRWPPDFFAALSATLASDGVCSVMIGGATDRPSADQVRAAFRERTARVTLFDVVGRTDLPTLAGLLTTCRGVVTNDSGAMHLAAAIGVPVTAVFGPTDEQVTRPLAKGAVVITGPAWCRPCMLRECPLDHQCMSGIHVRTVVEAVRRSL